MRSESSIRDDRINGQIGSERLLLCHVYVVVVGFLRFKRARMAREIR